MDKRSLESGISNFAFNVLLREDAVEGFYDIIENWNVITVMEKLKYTGKLIPYKGHPKLLYSYLKRVKVDWEEVPDLGECKFVVINKTPDGYIMEEVTP